MWLELFFLAYLVYVVHKWLRGKPKKKDEHRMHVSYIAAAVGIHPYKTSLELYNQLKGLEEEDKTIEGERAKEFGEGETKKTRA
jgi:hypothetical protein